ncbi:MAG: hypothetical protein GTN81_00635 [Proteobacteria bacterium]|nr:hypothetical protein [Pseudomonadota bacterium]
MMKGATVGAFLLAGLIFFPLGITGEEILNQVFLLVRERELVAFSAVQNTWVTLDLRSKEEVLDSRYDGHVAVAVTSRRVLGFSALTSRWAEERLMVGESVGSLEAEGNVGAVITNLRAFGFSASAGRWTVKRFELK